MFMSLVIVQYSPCLLAVRHDWLCLCFHMRILLLECSLFINLKQLKYFITRFSNPNICFLNIYIPL